MVMNLWMKKTAWYKNCDRFEFSHNEAYMNGEVDSKTAAKIFEAGVLKFVISARGTS